VSRIALIAISLCAFSLSECRKSTDEHTVPSVSVNISINVNLAQYNNLNFIGGWVYLPGGYNGILAYRANNDVINAYDRQAPYKVADECQVVVDSTGVICVDPCSKSQWLINDGQVLKGPAFYPLKQYHTTFDGLNLSITN